MKKLLKMIVIVLLVIIVIGIIGFLTYAYKNMHWYDAYSKSLKEVKAQEKQVMLPSGNVINYGEVENDKPALLLIHGQMGIWQDYALVMPELAKNWHIYAVDVYGHGKSTHNEELYYIDTNGDDLIWFIDNVIREKTVVAGHSNGGITTAYIAAYGGENVRAALLEDPPIFSTQGEGWENSFAYLDTYKVIHDYDESNKEECWEAYYLRHCYWGQLFMKDSMDKLADYAQSYHDKHPNKEVSIFFLPSSVWFVFKYAKDYDFAYGEHFYDLSWNHGYTHEQILSDINVPCVYMHAKENISETGVYLCAASLEQAKRAVGYIGDECKLIETSTSDHTIHAVHSKEYIDAINSLLDK